MKTERLTIALYRMAERNHRLYKEKINYNVPSFYNLVGAEFDLTPNDTYFTFSEDKVRKILMLASPHWQTILKTWEIQCAKTDT